MGPGNVHFNFNFVFKIIYSSFTKGFFGTPRCSIFKIAASSVDVTLMNGKFGTPLVSGEIHFCEVQSANEMKCSDLSCRENWSD